MQQHLSHAAKDQQAVVLPQHELVNYPVVRMNLLRSSIQCRMQELVELTQPFPPLEQAVEPLVEDLSDSSKDSCSRLMALSNWGDETTSGELKGNMGC